MSELTTRERDVLTELGGIVLRLSPFGRTILLKIAKKYEAGEREHGRADRAALNLEDWLNHTQEEAIDLMVYPEIIRSLYDVKHAPKRIETACACGYYCERCEQS